MRRRSLLVTMLALVCPALAAPAWSAVPIPPGPFDATAPGFIGEPVDDRPLARLDVPAHPFMAPTGRNSMHNDAYASDAYRWGGPLGRDPQVSSATYGVSECATIAFDSRDRIVGLCGSLDGFELKLIDPETLDQRAAMRTSTRDATSGANPATDLCGGAYFYLDHRDRAIVETNDGRILVVKVTRDGFEPPVFAPERSATENSIVAVGRSVIVENNYGYESPASVVGGQSTEPGVARVGVGGGSCGPRWTSDVIAPTSVPNVSLRSGLLYVYAKPEGDARDPFYFTAIDVRTGRTAWQRLTGTGSAYNNHYAASYLGPDRTAYIATLAGLLRVEG